MKYIRVMDIQKMVFVLLGELSENYCRKCRA